MSLGTDAVLCLHENPVSGVFASAHDEIGRHGALTVGTSAQENAPAGVGIGPQQGGEKLCFHWKASFLLQQFLPLSVVRKHPL